MKKVLYVIVGLIAIYLILCLFGPKEMNIERSTTVNAKPEVLVPMLGDLKFFHEKWSPWSELDPNMQVTYEGSAGAVGHLYKWSGNDDVKSGSIVIDSMLPRRVVQTLTFGEGDMKSKAWFTVVPEGEGSLVTWGMFGETPFLFRAMALFMNMEKMVGDHYEKGLAKLKSVVESTAQEAPKAAYEVKEMNWDEKTFVGKRSVVTFDKIGAFFGENLGKILEELKKNKVEPQMAPLGIFWKYDESKGETDMAAAMCVPNGTKLKGYEQWVTPATKVLMVEYYGDYAKTMPAHMAIDEYMKKNNLTQSMVIEEYANDPAEVKDTAKWLTNIYYVLNK